MKSKKLIKNKRKINKSKKVSRKQSGGITYEEHQNPYGPTKAFSISQEYISYRNTIIPDIVNQITNNFPYSDSAIEEVNSLASEIKRNITAHFNQFRN